MENHEMEKHEKFTEWARSEGIEINGVAPHRFAGRGLGIVATADHKTGATLIKVPFKALRTAYTVPKHISERIGHITVHGLLAIDLVMDKSPSRIPWKSILPTPEDFLESMPLKWDEALKALLPASAAALVRAQAEKVKLDWTAVEAVFPDTNYDEYLYAWLIVNTRTFHFTHPLTSKHSTPSNPNDRMALNPFADYINHTSAPGCTVESSTHGYKICADAPIAAGDEIYISYGSHSNDFLLAEYGFILSSNRWDEVPLDPFILPLLSKSQKEDLEDAGFLDKYVLDQQTVCYRTQVALRMLCLPERKWQQFVSGFSDGEADQPLVDELLKEILEKYLKHANKMRERVERLDDHIVLPIQRETIGKRWEQISILLQKHISDLP